MDQARFLWHNLSSEDKMCKKYLRKNGYKVLKFTLHLRTQ